jgi:hypothetical protein
MSILSSRVLFYDNQQFAPSSLVENASPAMIATPMSYQFSLPVFPLTTNKPHSTYTESRAFDFGSHRNASKPSSLALRHVELPPLRTHSTSSSRSTAVARSCPQTSEYPHSPSRGHQFSPLSSELSSPHSRTTHPFTKAHAHSLSHLITRDELPPDDAMHLPHVDYTNIQASMATSSPPPPFQTYTSYRTTPEPATHELRLLSHILGSTTPTDPQILTSNEHPSPSTRTASASVLSLPHHYDFPASPRSPSMPAIAYK